MNNLYLSNRDGRKVRPGEGPKAQYNRFFGGGASL